MTESRVTSPDTVPATGDPGDDTTELPNFLERRMAGEPDAPSLIPYYSGP
jgi:hypothetical protein